MSISVEQAIDSLQKEKGKKHEERYVAFLPIFNIFTIESQNKACYAIRERMTVFFGNLLYEQRIEVEKATFKPGAEN